VGKAFTIPQSLKPFNGKDDQNIKMWLFKVKKAMRAQCISESQKFEFGANILSGEAFNIYYSYCNSGGSSWDELRISSLKH